MKELALQASESDSQILIRLYSHTTPGPILVQVCAFTFIPILRCFYFSRQCEVSAVDVSNVRHSSDSRFSHVRHCSPQVHVLQHFRFASRWLTS